MPLVPLTEGAYTARSIIAEAQRCINLSPERNPKDSPIPSTHYPTPGLTITGFQGNAPFRGEYLASNGDMYTVFGNNSGSTLYVSTPSSTANGIGATTLVGTFNSAGSTPVEMADNGLVLIIVDGSTLGWCLDLTSADQGLAQITDPTFPGATTVGYLDTFLIFNQPGTNIWYISLTEANFQMFTGSPGGLLTGTIAENGDGSITNGTYTSTPLTGGSGTGGVATITVVGNDVTNVVPTSPGTDYQIGDNLSATLPGTAIASGVVTSGGSGYTDGTYSNTALTSGSGSGATANITVTGGAISSVVIVNPGTGYAVSNTLSAVLPGGTGFIYTVATTAGGNFTFTVDTISGQAFDPLDFATKTGYPDAISGLIVMDLYIWLLGTQTTEIWFNAGAADFTFQIFPGVFIEHGCAAPYSIAKQDLSIYWLSKDKQGQCIVLKGNSFAAHRISTFAIENEFSTYPIISDAIGSTYQQNGHTFYVLVFPTADKTWVFDESSQLWHERNSLQTIQGANTLVIDGNLHKTLYQQITICGGLPYGCDGLGNQYLVDINNYTENGVAIPRIRSFPHLVQNMNRVSYKSFIADMETGTDDPTVTGDGSSSAKPPVVNLRWSDNRGKTYGSYVQQSIGALGKYLTNIQWRRLGFARDRVFEISWSVPTQTALNGAWVETEKMGS